MLLMKFPASFVLAPLLTLATAAFTLTGLVLTGATFLKPVLWFVTLFALIQMLLGTLLALFNQTDNDLEECAAEIGMRWADEGKNPRLEYFYIGCASVSLVSACASFGSILYGQTLCDAPECMAARLFMPVLVTLPSLTSGAQCLLMRKKNHLASRLSQISLGLFLVGLTVSTLPFLQLTID